MKKIYNFGMSFIVIALISCTNYGTKLKFNGGELYFTKNVNKEDAEKLGKYLVEQKFYDGNPKTVQLNKENDTFQFRMVVKEELQNDVATINMMKVFAGELSQNVFNGKPVVMHICDKFLKTLKILREESWGVKLIFNGGELYYTSKVTEAEAQKLGKYLVDEGFYDGNPKTVQLNKDGETYQFRMVIKKDLEKEESTINSMKVMIDLLSDKVFNHAKVVVHLCDEYLNTVKEVREEEKK